MNQSRRNFRGAQASRYRGYDSAGVATIERHADPPARRGKLEEPGATATARAALGHHRYRPHPVGDARPPDRKTPIRMPPKSSPSCTTASSRISPSCAVSSRPRAPNSRPQTDSEVVAHLVTDELKRGAAPVEAVRAALPRLHGAFALAFLFAGEDNLLIGARRGSPLAIGYGDGEMFVGSDAIALAPFTARELSGGRRLGHPHPAAAPRSTTQWHDRRSPAAQVASLDRCWSTRATIATSWRKKFTNSPRSSATRLRFIST